MESSLCRIVRVQHEPQNSGIHAFNPYSMVPALPALSLSLAVSLSLGRLSFGVFRTRQANATKPQEARGTNDAEEKAADAASAADEKSGIANPGSLIAAAPATAGEYLGYTGNDPVTGQLVRSGELVKSTPGEVAEYLKHYNELDGGEENDKDGAVAASGGAGDNFGGVRGTGRGGVNEAFGANRGLNEARDSKNSEGRAKDSAPVASAGAGPYRQAHNGMPAAG